MRTPHSTLVLGNHPIGRDLQSAATSQGHRVTLGLDDIDFETDQEWPNLQKLVAGSLPLDTVILTFDLTGKEAGDGSCEAVDQVIWPIVKAVKTVLFHWRRDQRHQTAKNARRLIIVAHRDTEHGTTVTSNAILGFFRSIVLKVEVIGARTHLIYADWKVDADRALAVKTALEPSPSEPTVTIIRAGSVHSQPPSQGECYSQPIVALGSRLRPIVRLVEDVRAFNLQYRALSRPSADYLLQSLSTRSGILAYGLRILAAPLSFLLAAAALRYDYHVDAFVAAFIATKTGWLAPAMIIVQLVLEKLQPELPTTSAFFTVLCASTVIAHFPRRW